MSIWDIFERIDRAREHLADAPDDEALALEDDLDEIEDSARGLTTTVALLGDTNVGKSTLINALLGANILPRSGVGIGTASMTRLSYRPGPEYVAEIQFTTRGELTQQCLFLYEHERSLGQEGVVDLEFVEMLDAVKRRLHRIYGASLAAYLESGRLGVLAESDDAQAALSEGKRTIVAPTEHDLRTQLVDFIDSSGTSPQLVRHVSITGPFDALQTGTTLVDLPGLNDPDAHRSSITQRAVANADVVWIVFAVDAGIAKSLIRAVQSMLPLHELLLEGRANRLAFVVTKCDQIDRGDASRIGIDPGADLDRFIEARRQFVERDIRQKMDLLTLPFRTKLGSAANQALDALRSTPIYFVSSLDHLRFVGADTGEATFETDEQTQLPRLAADLVRVGAERSATDAVADVVTRLERLEARIARLGADSSEPEPVELVSRQTGTFKRFEADLNGARDDFQRDLAVAQAQLISTLADAARRMVVFIDDAAEKWSQMTPATLQATAMRRGLFIAHGGQRHDLNADIAQPFLYAAYPAWTAFFDQTLPLLIRQYQSQLAETTTRALAEFHPSAVAPAVLVARSFERESLDLVKAERGDIVGALVEVIREELNDVYEDVTADDTSFAKTAAIQRIRKAVLDRQTELCDAVRDELESWLGGLADHLARLAQRDAEARSRAVAELALERSA